MICANLHKSAKSPLSVRRPVKESGIRDLSGRSHAFVKLDPASGIFPPIGAQL